MELTIIRVKPECQIGASTYDIRWSDKFLENMNLSAHISRADQMIRLSHRKRGQVWLGLLHEACHGIVEELGITIEGDLEAAVNALSNGMAIFLNSLNIVPDFSQIPEEFLSYETTADKPK